MRTIHLTMSVLLVLGAPGVALASTSNSAPVPESAHVRAPSLEAPRVIEKTMDGVAGARGPTVRRVETPGAKEPAPETHAPIVGPTGKTFTRNANGELEYKGMPVNAKAMEEHHLTAGDLPPVRRPTFAPSPPSPLPAKLTLRTQADPAPGAPESPLLPPFVRLASTKPSGLSSRLRRFVDDHYIQSTTALEGDYQPSLWRGPIEPQAKVTVSVVPSSFDANAFRGIREGEGVLKQSSIEIAAWAHGHGLEGEAWSETSGSLSRVVVRVTGTAAQIEKAMHVRLASFAVPNEFPKRVVGTLDQPQFPVSLNIASIHDFSLAPR